MAISSDFRWAWLLAAGLCVGCAEQQDLSCGADEVRLSPQVYGGVEADLPWLVLIDMEVDDEQRSLCSGALLGPRVVLTAAHCTVGVSRFRVYAPDAEDRVAFASRVFTVEPRSEVDEVFSDQELHMPHGFSDVALLILDEEILASRYPTIARSSGSWGDEVETFGRRIDDVTPHTARRSSSLYRSPPIELAVTPSPRSLLDATLEGTSEEYFVPRVVVIPGDSGGPVVLAGTEEIVAVNSAKSPCGALFARVDTQAELIDDALEKYPGEGRARPDCGDVDETGVCDGELLRFCEGGVLVELDCAPVDVCGEAGSVMDCVDRPPPP